MSDVAIKGEVVASATLAENEETIRRGLGTFVEVGLALKAIRDGRQFEQRGYETFEDYCREVWDLSAKYAHEQIGAAGVTAIAVANGLPAPRNEWTARPLVKLLNEQGEQAVVEAWSAIVEGHEESPTGIEVRRALNPPAGSRGRPGWRELAGIVADTLSVASDQLAELEQQMHRAPVADFAEQLERYAQRADDVAARLRALAGGHVRHQLGKDEETPDA